LTVSVHDLGTGQRRSRFARYPSLPLSGPAQCIPHYPASYRLH
jgi:hypothetical protein